MASRGYHSPPLIVKKFVKKLQMQSTWFLQVLPKSSWVTIKTIFETLWPLGTCHVTIIGGVVYKKSRIFEVFWEYLGELLIFFREIFFGSMIFTRLEEGGLSHGITGTSFWTKYGALISHFTKTNYISLDQKLNANSDYQNFKAIHHSVFERNLSKVHEMPVFTKARGKIRNLWLLQHHSFIIGMT